ncbi:MAG: RNA polymerase sigma factor [Oscillospiraceae bacterium]|nr:RNA polymerase sigma factor [Oscillospiraceae bacterium]
MFRQTRVIPTAELASTGYKPNNTNANITYAEPQSRAYDSVWLEAFVRKHENKIFRTALAIMGNKTDAEDVMQEVFLKVLVENQKATFSFESDAHEEAWLTRVTVNQCKDALRLSKWKRTVPIEDIQDTYVGYDQSSENNRLMESVNALPPKQRIATFLYYYEGYSIKEICDITGQNESTVKSHLSRARKRLKDLLLEDYD